jgi:hypothetical protein
VTAGSGTTCTPSRDRPCVICSNSCFGLDELRKGLVPQVGNPCGCEEGDGGGERELHVEMAWLGRKKDRVRRVCLDIVYET